MTMRTFLRWHRFTSTFFLYRLYPPIRFVVVSGGKSSILDAVAVGSLGLFRRGWATCYRGALHGDLDWYTVDGGSEKHVYAMRSVLEAAREPAASIQTDTSVVRVRHDRGRDRVLVNYSAAAGYLEEWFDGVVMATPADDAVEILGPDAPAWARQMTTEVITVALHSDARLMGEGVKVAADGSAADGSAADGLSIGTGTARSASNREQPACAKRAPGVIPTADAEPNMVYVASSTSNTWDGSLSVYWDSIHGEHVEPRPILTYNPGMVMGNTPLRGEVFRTQFKHLQLPSLTTFLEGTLGVSRSRSDPSERIFWAGAFTDFSYSHPGALISGVRTALALGARYNTTSFFLSGDEFRDPPGIENLLRASGGSELGVGVPRA